MEAAIHKISHNNKAMVSTAAAAAADAILPNPVFEGSEKRLEVDFVLGGAAPAHGLRALCREQLDELMTLAHCCIVSSRSNQSFDAYVLSESSLFVYPTKWVLKTCGTTRLLDSVPRLLEMASAIGVQPVRAKFSRATFLFPEQQVRRAHGCSRGGWWFTATVGQSDHRRRAAAKGCAQYPRTAPRSQHACSPGLMSDSRFPVAPLLLALHSLFLTPALRMSALSWISTLPAPLAPLARRTSWATPTRACSGTSTWLAWLRLTRPPTTWRFA